MSLSDAEIRIGSLKKLGFEVDHRTPTQKNKEHAIILKKNGEWVSAHADTLDRALRLAENAFNENYVKK